MEKTKVVLPGKSKLRSVYRLLNTIDVGFIITVVSCGKLWFSLDQAMHMEVINNHLSVLAFIKQENQYSIRSPKSTDRQLPVAIPPGINQLLGSNVGSSHHRYICICHNSSHNILQYSVLSSKPNRCKRSGPARLYISQQFRKWTSLP